MKFQAPAGLVKLLNQVVCSQGTRQSNSTEFGAGHLHHLQVLARHRNVVGVGLSEKVSGDETTGEFSLCFYVRKKAPLRKLRADTAIPPVVCDERKRAYLTDVKEIGACRLHMANGLGIGSGNSVSNIADNAGTITAIVQKSGKLFILSNSHVLARSGKAKMGEPIVSPGTTDGGHLPADALARLTAFVPFSKDVPNRVDAAIAEVLPERLASLRTAIPGVDVPVRTMAPMVGMTVTKTGRTTQATQAQVIDLHFRVSLPYPNGVGLVRFTDQILCTAFADGGDSGSLVSDVSSRSVVGMHFAGNENVSIFHPIAPVLSALGISFAT